MSLLLQKLAGLGVVCEESQVLTVKAAADLADGEHTDEINTKGATKLYVIREVREVAPTTTVTSTVITGSPSNHTNAVDKDDTTAVTGLLGSGSGVIEIQYDFGSDAARKFGYLYKLFRNASVSGKIEVRFNTDGNVGTPATWTAYTVIASGLNLDQIFLHIEPLTTFRHAEVRWTGISVGGIDFFGYEAFDVLEGWGRSDLEFEIKDDARGDWKAIPDEPVFATLETYDGTKTDVKEVTAIMPHKATGLFRTKITQSGKNNHSMIIVKVDPCKV